MTGLALATCDVPLPPGNAPDWVQLLPGSGTVKGRDGRSWELVDPGAVVLAFDANGADLPIDYEHQNDNPDAKLKGPVPAAGWIKEMRADDGGIWGRVEWTATAAELIGRKEYRYISPVLVYHEKTRQIVRLKGAGLVHTPNLYLTALASQADAMNPQTPPAKPDDDKTRIADDKTRLAAFVAMVAKMLGLPPETPQEELMAALKAKVTGDPDPAKFVPVETVQAMLAERNLSIATASEGQARQKADKALQSGHLSPAMKDWATALCRSDEASFDRFIASSIPQFAHLSKTVVPPGPPGAGRSSEADQLADAICSQLGLKPGALDA
jgi:phage I-like protein